MKSRPKLLFLGICAGAHEHFLDWCRSGVLPNLQRLVANGLVGRTRNVPAVFVQCTWPSFYTGTGPARQGVHCWEQLKTGNVRVLPRLHSRPRSNHALLGSLERSRQACRDSRRSAVASFAANQRHPARGVGSARCQPRVRDVAPVAQGGGALPLRSASSLGLVRCGQNGRGDRRVSRRAPPRHRRQSPRHEALSRAGELGFLCPGVHRSPLHRPSGVAPARPHAPAVQRG